MDVYTIGFIILLICIGFMTYYLSKYYLISFTRLFICYIVCFLVGWFNKEITDFIMRLI